MPKKLLATTIILSTILAVSILSTLPLLKANFYPTPSLFFEGPKYITYGVDSFSATFKVEVHIAVDAPAVVSIIYSLDGSANISNTKIDVGDWSLHHDSPSNHKIYSIEEKFDDLSYGNHTLNVYSVDAEDGVLSSSIDFSRRNPNVSSSPTPTPTQSMPTINTGPSLPLELNPSLVYIILAIVIVIFAIALVSLVYFRRKSKLTK